MVEALVSEISKRIPYSNFVFPWGTPDASTFDHYENIGLSVCVENWHAYGSIREKVAWSRGNPKLAFMRFAPKLAARLFGKIAHSDLDGVFVVNGYLLNGRHNKNYLKGLLGYFSTLKREGVPVIFLPKTFGPFSKSWELGPVKSIVICTSVLYSRDTQSTSILREIIGGDIKIEQSPDYTTSVGACHLEKYDALRGGVAIIPNARMIDKTTADTSEKYISFLGNVIKFLLSLKLNPFLLLHARNADEPLASQIIERVGVPIPIINEPNHLVVKGIIGSSRFAVSSRLHGIINGLSQGVPVVGTSWSHKYSEVYSEYGCRELLVQADLNDHEVRGMINSLNDDEVYSNIKDRIAHHKNLIVSKNETMWNSIADKISKNI